MKINKYYFGINKSFLNFQRFGQLFLPECPCWKITPKILKAISQLFYNEAS